MSGAPDTTGTGTGGATGATGAVGAGGGDINQPWYTGVDQETVGYLQNRGLDKQDAKAAALAAIKSHREAEKLLGAPADQMIRLPKDGNDPAWRSVHHKLGVPQDAKEYDFSDLKFADGSELQDDFATFLRTTFHSNNVSKASAIAVARDVVKFLDGLGAKGEGDQSAQLAVEKDKLKQDWGYNYNQNMIVAQNAARALGVSEEDINQLQSLKSVGFARTLEIFRTIGEKIGEDKFIRTPSGGNHGPMTVPAAREQLAAFKADKAWVAKFEAGDTEARRQFNNVTEIIAAAESRRFE